MPALILVFFVLLGFVTIGPMAMIWIVIVLLGLSLAVAFIVRLFGALFG